MNIDRKQSEVITHSNSLFALVPAKSVVELNSPSETTKNPKQLLDEIQECPVIDGLTMPDSISTVKLHN